MSPGNRHRVGRLTYLSRAPESRGALRELLKRYQRALPSKQGFSGDPINPAFIGNAYQLTAIPKQASS